MSSILLLRLAAFYVLGQRSLGIRHHIEINDLRHKLMLSLCQDIGINSTVKLTQSSQVVSPVTLLNREICLPEWTASQIQHDELRSLLAHELGHIKARDLQTMLGLYLLSCVFFFQPLFLLARSRLQDMSEFLADEFAANQCGPKPVVNVLLNCVEKIQSHRSYPWRLAMLENNSRLNHRVKRLLQVKQRESKISVTMHRIFLCVLCLPIFAVPSFKYGKANELEETQLSDLIIPMSAEHTEIADAESNEYAVPTVSKGSLLAVTESDSAENEMKIVPVSPPQSDSNVFALAKISQAVPNEKPEPKILVLHVVEQAQTFARPGFDLLVQTDAPEHSPVNIAGLQQDMLLGKDQSALVEQQLHQTQVSASQLDQRVEAVQNSRKSEPQANDAAYIEAQSQDLAPALSRTRPTSSARPPNNRTPGTLGPSVMRAINEIQNLMSPKDGGVEPDYEAAKEILDKLYNRRYRRANSFEKDTIQSFYTKYHLEMKDYAAAIDTYQERLTIAGLGKAARLRALKGLGTLHSMEENWRPSLDYFRQWREESIEEDDVVF